MGEELDVEPVFAPIIEWTIWEMMLGASKYPKIETNAMHEPTTSSVIFIILQMKSR